MSFLEKDYFKFHYQGIGFLESTFPKNTEGEIVVNQALLQDEYNTYDDFVFEFTAPDPENLAVTLPPNDHQLHYDITYSFCTIQVFF